MLRRIGRLGILGLAVALLALPATGSAKKKANPCAKKKAEKKGCVLKVVAYGNKSGDPLFYLQAGAVYDKPTKSVLTVSFKDSCGDIRIVDLKATAYPKIGTTLKFSATYAGETGGYVGSATATFTAKAMKVTGKATLSPAGQPECAKTWSASVPRYA